MPSLAARIEAADRASLGRRAQPARGGDSQRPKPPAVPRQGPSAPCCLPRSAPPYLWD